MLGMGDSCSGWAIHKFGVIVPRIDLMENGGGRKPLAG